MFNIHYGSTRAVVVTKRYAIKFPRLRNFDSFFKGLCSNEKERIYSSQAPDYFVPVLFAIPGLVVVMPRCKPFGGDNPMVRCFMADLWHPNNDQDNEQAFIARRFCEYINNNYAMYKGKPMCIDYGTYIRPETNEADFNSTMFYLKAKTKQRVEDLEGRSNAVDPQDAIVPWKQYMGTVNHQVENGDIRDCVSDSTCQVKEQIPG